MRKRLPRDDMFMEIAGLFAQRSSCERGQVGCVIVVDRHAVSHGYNGAPPGMPQCDEVGCGGGYTTEQMAERDLVFGVSEYVIETGEVTDVTSLYYPHGCTRSIHAEANAVAWAARLGARIDGGTSYCTHAPCLPCAQLLLASGITTVMYRTPYRLTEGVDLLAAAGIRLVRLT